MSGKLKAGCGAAVLALAGTAVANGSGAGPARNGKVTFWISGRATGIEVVGADGSGRRVLARAGPCTPLPAEPRCGFYGMAWSPDGRRLAFVRRAADTTLSLVQADGRHETELMDCSAPQPCDGSLAWSPDGSTVVVARGGSLYAVHLKGHTVHRLTQSAHDREPAWSPDGSRIAFTRGFLYTLSPKGAGVRKVSGTFGAYSPSWSPDGASIVFARAAGVYTVRADGSRLTRIATVPNWADNVAWSPDGTRILYGSTPGSSGAFSGEVWVMRPDGTQRHRVYRQECCVDYSPTAVWSPDGAQVAISAAGGFSVVNADGSGLHLLADGVIATGSAGSPLLTWQPVQ
jgi:Tol biopolymer transport system component